MNIFLWTLQVVLALWNITGGIYMVNNYKDIANMWALNIFPQPLWIALGVFQILFAVGLVLPALLKKPKLTSVFATGLTIISLLGVVLYVAYQGFPGMLWGLIPAALEAFVAYKRIAKS